MRSKSKLKTDRFLENDSWQRVGEYIETKQMFTLSYPQEIESKKIHSIQMWSPFPELQSLLSQLY